MVRPMSPARSSASWAARRRIRIRSCAGVRRQRTAPASAAARAASTSSLPATGTVPTTEPSYGMAGCPPCVQPRQPGASFRRSAWASGPSMLPPWRVAASRRRSDLVGKCVGTGPTRAERVQCRCGVATERCTSYWSAVSVNACQPRVGNRRVNARNLAKTPPGVAVGHPHRIREIAVQAGLSERTVDWVLNNRGGVRPSTIRRSAASHHRP